MCGCQLLPVRIPASAVGPHRRKRRDQLLRFQMGDANRLGVPHDTSAIRTEGCTRHPTGLPVDDFFAADCVPDLQSRDPAAPSSPTASSC